MPRVILTLSDATLGHVDAIRRPSESREEAIARLVEIAVTPVPVTVSLPRQAVPALTDEQQADLRERYDAGETQVELAAAYGIAQGTVSRYLAGRKYAGLDARLRQQILAFVSARPRTSARVANQFSMTRQRAEEYLTSLLPEVAIDNYGRLWGRVVR